MPASDIAFWLFDLTLRATLILALACLGIALLARASSAVRHMIWTTAVAARALPLLMLGLPAWRALPQWEKPHPATPAVPVAAQPSPAAHAQALSQMSPAQPPADPPPTAILLLPDPTPITQITANPRPTSAAPAPPSASILPIAASTQPPTWPLWFLTLYIAGAGICLTPLLAAYFALLRLQLRTRPLAHPYADRILEQCQRDLGIRRRITLLTAPGAAPMTFNILSPKILLPADCIDWSQNRWHIVLRHELAHISRHDLFTQFLAQLMRALYWFHPLAWFVCARMAAERKRACDDLALGGCLTPALYAEELFTIAQSSNQSSRHASRAVRLATAAILPMARLSSIESRVRAVLDATRSRRRLSGAVLLTTLIASTAILLPLAALRASVDTAPASPPSNLRKIADAMAAYSNDQATANITITTSGPIPATDTAGAHALDGTPIFRIQVIGANTTPEKLIREKIQAKVGDKYSREHIDADVRAIASLDRFLSVHAEVQPMEDTGALIPHTMGLDLRFVVQERPLIKQIDILGNTKIPTDDIRKVLTLHPDEAIEMLGIEANRKAIEDLYLARTKTGVTVSIDPDLLNTRGIVQFHINEAASTPVHSPASGAAAPAVNPALIAIQEAEVEIAKHRAADTSEIDAEKALLEHDRVLLQRLVNAAATQTEIDEARMKVTIDEARVNIAQSNLEEARLKLNQAQAVLQAVKAGVVTSLASSADQALHTPGSSPAEEQAALALAKHHADDTTELEATRQNLESAQIDYERVKQLHDKGLVAQAEFDAADARLAQAKAQINIAQARHEEEILKYKLLQEQINARHTLPTTVAPASADTMVPADKPPSANQPGEFYIMGSVARPGVYSLNGSQLTLKQALATAGIATGELSHLTATLLRRTGQNTETIVYNIHPDALFKGTEPDRYLQANDVIKVESTAATQPAATATATLDPHTGAITGVTVTNPGAAFTATSPSPPAEHPLVTRINTMPQNLWKTADETGVREQARDAWWDKNITPDLGTFTFTGKLAFAHVDTATNAAKTSVVVVTITCPDQIILGKSTIISVEAPLGNVKPEDAIDWKEGTPISITGTFQHAYLGGGMLLGGPELRVTLKDAKKN